MRQELTIPDNYYFELLLEPGLSKILSRFCCGVRDRQWYNDE